MLRTGRVRRDQYFFEPVVVSLLRELPEEVPVVPEPLVEPEDMLPEVEPELEDPEPYPEDPLLDIPDPLPLLDSMEDSPLRRRS